jgi:hypothetical protein
MADMRPERALSKELPEEDEDVEVVEAVLRLE